MDIKEETIENKICPLEVAVNTIKGKWKIPVIWLINEGKKRPSEFIKGIGKVDRRVLNQQLKEMLQDGILEKQVFHELPPKVEYTLTDTGQQLVAVLWGLNDWGKIIIEKQKN